MDVHEIEKRLRDRREALDRLGVERLEVFGSVSRSEATKESDVDVLVTFKGRVTLDRFMRVRRLLEETLGREVDLVTPRGLPPRLKRQIQRDLRRVA